MRKTPAHGAFPPSSHLTSAYAVMKTNIRGKRFASFKIGTESLSPCSGVASGYVVTEAYHALNETQTLSSPLRFGTAAACRLHRYDTDILL